MFGQGLPLGFAGGGGPASVDFLVVAGGGGIQTPSQNAGGGSGAGGLRTSYGSTSGGGSSSESQITLNPGVTYTITVGAAGSTGGFVNNPGNGNDSYISGADITTITSLGGGGGGTRGKNGSNGGSGGGGGWAEYSSSNQTKSGGTGTANQGYGGGTSRWPSYLPDGYSGGGGGGGAGGAGSTNSTAAFWQGGFYFRNGGNGGNALGVAITGANIYYAGGQPGYPGYYDDSGNYGSWDSNFTPAANSGGGRYSGVVILRILTSLYSGNTTGSPTVTTDGNYTIVKYTGSGTYTQ
jgi:hypothetical protein